MKENLFLITLYLYLEQKHQGKAITKIKLVDTGNAEKPHNVKLTLRDKHGLTSDLNLDHQQDCMWIPAKLLKKK